MTRRIQTLLYLVSMLAIAVGAFLPWMGWNHNYLLVYGFDPLWGKLLVPVALLGITLALAGPTETLSDSSPRGMLSRVIMAMFGAVSLVLVYLTYTTGLQKVVGVPPNSLLAGLSTTAIASLAGLILGAVTDWAGTGGATGVYEPEEEEEYIEKTPIVPIHHMEPAHMTNHSSGGVATLVEPSVSTGARRRAELKAAEQLELLENAYRTGEISDIEYATRKLSFAAKVDEYELSMMIEAKLQALQLAVGSGKLSEAGYEAKLRALRAAVRKAVGGVGVKVK